MAGDRLVLVATVAGLTRRMAVREPMFVAVGTDSASIVTITAVRCIMLAAGSMTYVADTIEWCGGPGIIQAALFSGKNNLGAINRQTEDPFGTGGYHVLYHVDIIVAVRIVTIPTELTALPYRIKDFISIQGLHRTAQIFLQGKFG